MIDNIFQCFVQKYYYFYARNFISSVAIREIAGAEGYKRNISFIHLSKYGRFCNNLIVYFSPFSCNSATTSVLIRSYIKCAFITALKNVSVYT